jgi:NTP pyrophosphatase (non-canonical NTP hydrolase)
MTPELINKIIKAVQHAKEKHPVFCANGYHAISLATEELGELAKAMNDADLEQVELEALDTIAVLVRIIENFQEVYPWPKGLSKEEIDHFNAPVKCKEMYVNGEKIK